MSTFPRKGWAWLLVAGLTIGHPVAAQDEHDPSSPGLDVAIQLQDAFARVAEDVFPSVVSITTYERDPRARRRRGNDWQVGGEQAERYPGFKKVASGSGLIVGDEGYILTCRHILLRPNGQLATVIDVETQDDRHTLSRVVGTEPTLNLAVLELEVYEKRLPPKAIPATVADPRKSKVGHWALSVGDPAGPEKTYATGLLATLPERACYQGEITATYLHASLNVHPEAYGGPLVNIHGEVLGIMVPRGPLPELSPSIGHEYALPIDIAMGIYEAMKIETTFESPWLGFSVLELAQLRVHIKDPNALARIRAPRTGIYIDDVFEPSPAAKADIRVGDFLTHFDGERILSVLGFQKALYLGGVGRTVSLDLVRDGRAIKKRLKIEVRPEDAITR